MEYFSEISVTFQDYGTYFIQWVSFTYFDYDNLSNLLNRRHETILKVTHIEKSMEALSHPDFRIKSI